jgi:hypothetical protein
MARCALAVTALSMTALAVGGCSSSSKASVPLPKATTTTVAPVGGAHITSFVVPASVRCGATSKTSVKVIYAVEGSAREELSIDGRAIPLGAASASVSEEVHCDGLPHTVALIAYDAKGVRTSQVKMLTTVLPA